MARYKGPRVRISRRFGVAIFGNTKYLERRQYGPGVHGPRQRRKSSEYALGLIEKQKMRYYYGLLEKQFRNIYEAATHRRGVTGTIMLVMLETRLDNVVYQLGFGQTRAQARQMIVHGHILVNGRKVTIPSYEVKVGDTVDIKEKAVSRQLASHNMELSTNRIIPAWLGLNKDSFRGTIMRLPTREDIQPIANDQAVVEFYSR